MEVNDFEKRLQSRMDDFKLTPSTQVWNKVEEELRTHKRRRIFLLLLMVGLIVGIATIAVQTGFFTGTYKKQVEEKNSTPSANGTPTSTQLTPQQHLIEKEKIPHSTGNTELEKETFAINKISKEKINTPYVKKESGNGKLNMATHEIDVQTSIKIINENNIDLATTHLPKKINQLNKQVDDEINSVKENAKTNSPTIENVAITQQVINTHKPSIEIAKEEQSKKINAPLTTIDLSADTTLQRKIITVRSNKKRDIKGLYFLAAYGTVRSKDHVFSLGNEKASLDAAYSIPTTTSLIRYYPSSVSVGNYWDIGVGINRNISKKIAATAALTFRRISNTTKVGFLNTNSTVNIAQVSNTFLTAADYYSGPMNFDYQNHYNYLLTPLSITWQLNKATAKLPLKCNISISPGYLIYTNALIYDTVAQGIFYHNASRFKRMSFSTGAGFTADIGLGKHYTIQAGPQFAINTTSVLKGNTAVQYFGFTGVQAILTRKKEN